jgi:hypothetical protein
MQSTSSSSGDERISLIGSSFQKLKDNILQLGSHYGYIYLIKSCATKWVINTTTGDIFYEDPINMPERIQMTKGNWLESMLVLPGEIDLLGHASEYYWRPY